MKQIDSVTSLRKLRADWQKENLRIGFVPTMGNLHDGHLSLLRQARAKADKVVCSIFVNPLQFDKPEDLLTYPRTLKQDIVKLAALGCDLLFLPTSQMMYPHGVETTTRVEVPGITTLLDGAHRPGHFVGVATVVCKLLGLVQPDFAIFGRKDFQQLQVVRRMVEDLNLPVQIIGAPTVREPSGLAMSSRNNHLNDAQRQQAAGIFRALRHCAQQLRAGRRDYSGIESEAVAQLTSDGFVPDYLRILHINDLHAPDIKDHANDLIALVAAHLGKVRLIDNLVLDDEQPD